MLPKYSTPVPNRLFDEHLHNLKGAELKVLLVIIRQTLGWQTRNHQRKSKDWIAPKQFEQKTGLSRKTINQAINSLKDRNLIKRFYKNNNKRRTFFSCSIGDEKKVPQTEKKTSYANRKKIPHLYTKETHTKKKKDLLDNRFIWNDRTKKYQSIREYMNMPR